MNPGFIKFGVTSLRKSCLVVLYNDAVAGLVIANAKEFPTVDVDICPSIALLFNLIDKLTLLDPSKLTVDVVIDNWFDTPIVRGVCNLEAVPAFPTNVVAFTVFTQIAPNFLSLAPITGK